MVYKFGTFEFHRDGRELRRNGRLVALEPQPTKALATLLAKRGDVVSREELRDAVWGQGTHVDFDRGIAYCLSQIRTALGDSADNPRFIQTIPKRGFKFIAPLSSSDVISVASDDTRSKGSNGPSTSKGIVLLGSGLVVLVVGLLLWAFRSEQPARIVIAVSVFDNETGSAEYDRPVASLSDVVVEHLSKLDPDRIAVVGNAEVLRRPRNIRNLKAVAENVKADYVLLGQLQKGEAGLRFITHFIRLEDETHLKANRLAVADAGLAGLEAAVVEEFDRATLQYVLHRPAN